MSDTIKDALMILIQENGARGASARRYPSVKRALRAIGIEENSDGWHEVLWYLGYHDREKRVPYAWVVPKPRPKGFRIVLKGWRHVGVRRRPVDEGDGVTLPKYTGETFVQLATRVGVRLDGYKTAKAALAAGAALRKPDDKRVYAEIEAEPIYE
jgi:hypothetical protein